MNFSRYQESSPSTLNGRSNRTAKTNWTGDFQPSPDDDTFWADYLERDFQTVYETAHREDVANWHKTKLIEEITHLEKRHKELVNKLSRLDPEIYLRRLQSRVVGMQQRNNMLKSERKTADAENYNQLDDVQESSEAEPLEEASNNCKECENLCEVPSQSNIINTEQDTAISTDCKSIVSLAPDSTKE